LPGATAGDAIRSGKVPQFYLHIHNAHGEAEDDEGLEVPSLAVAREKAVHGIRSLLAAEAMNGSFNLDGRIDIKDAAGKVLLTVPFKEAVAVTGGVTGGKTQTRE
jgi:hypothetical protein